MKRFLILLTIVALSLGSLALAQGPAAGDKQTGVAAVYSDALDGHVTASGQTYDKTKLTAAHKTLPFGTKVKLTNPKNNRSVIVRITDRGPMQADRMLDISPAAAARLRISPKVMREVNMEVLQLGSGKTVKQVAKK
jgi:rare lipoprotein A